MQEMFHFGTRARALLGVRHAPAVPSSRAIVLCAPLLQEGMRCQRALWSLADALASGGVAALRFDWFGSGDSAGASDAMDVLGMVGDVAAAESLLRPSAAAPPPGFLALRSAALPLLAHASARREPVDVVLWAPLLDGRALVTQWREQHRQQLHGAGRFLTDATESGDDELLGVVVSRALLDGLEALQGNALLLPAGSRLLIAQWPASPVDAAFVDAQRAAGVTVDSFDLAAGDEPDWDDAQAFDAQILPRQSVRQLAARLAVAA